MATDNKKDDIEDLRLTDLIEVEMLQSIQDAFSDMTGMAALTADKNGVAVTQGSNFTEFCMKYTRRSLFGCMRCFECDKHGAVNPHPPLYPFDINRAIA